MKVLLVDDEPVMHLIMRQMLAKFAKLEVVAALSDVPSAEKYMKEHTDIDLAFVDIAMPGGTGLQLVTRLDEEGCKTQIVFVTSHKDYALDAFELSALDYLVKPVTQERLERTVQRALQTKEVQRAQRQVGTASLGLRTVTVSALGDFSIRNEIGRVRWISSKCAELFAFLLLERGKWISRHRLIENIFAGMTSSNAEKYLNTTVYQLRKSLEPIGIRETIRSENDGYVLELEGPAVDYEQFERELDRLGNIDAGKMEAALQIERLYTGDLFGSKAYVWAIYETDRLAGRYAAFVLQTAKVLLEEGHTAGASKLLQKLYVRNPLDESVVRLLMRKHAQDGDKKGLTMQYTEFVKLLNKELGIRPSKELILLYDSYIIGLSDKTK